MHARPVRALAVTVLCLAAVAAVVVALSGVPLLLLVVPVLVVAAYAVAVRMPLGKVLDAASSPDDDPGRGPAGMLP